MLRDEVLGRQVAVEDPHIPLRAPDCAMRWRRGALLTVEALGSARPRSTALRAARDAARDIEPAAEGWG